MIKFKLVKFEKAVVFQILEQSEEITSRGGAISFEWGDFRITSEMRPQLLYNDVCIRGYKSKDDNIIEVLSFSSNADRDAYYDKMIDAFKAFCKNGGFNKKESRDHMVEQDVFEF